MKPPASNFTPDMMRRADETMAQWANRMKARRGTPAGTHWVQSPDGTLVLTGIREPQSKLDLK